METSFLLMAQYGAVAVVPLDLVVRDYFSHLTPAKLLAKVDRGEIKLPVVRIEASNKAARGVHLQDLAQYIDGRRDAAERELAQVRTEARWSAGLLPSEVPPSAQQAAQREAAYQARASWLPPLGWKDFEPGKTYLGPFNFANDRLGIIQQGEPASGPVAVEDGGLPTHRGHIRAVALWRQGGRRGPEPIWLEGCIKVRRDYDSRKARRP